MDLRIARPRSRMGGENRLHLGDFRVAERVVLEVRKTPPRLGARRIKRERGLVSRLVSLQRLVLPQEARRGGGCGDPALRIIRFDRAQIPRGSLGLV